MKKAKKIKFKSILRLLVIALCGGILGVNLYTANANKLVGNQLPMPFGYGWAVVLSGSMEPAISVDDLIIVSEKTPYTVGDTVVYQQGNMLVVHRVTAIEGDMVTTQGDANNVADAPINKNAIKGTVVAVLPKVGLLVSFVRTPIGTIAIAAAAVALVELPYRKEKEKDDEERQKIIDEIKRLKDQQ